ncbi:MAG: tripartite tricarboxylate transporter TctB family protein [Lachnospiraceae bacterium]|nr:tripartite tricarboxylate transporter TctB family protein [Lachnospiraceae bacterium]
MKKNKYAEYIFSLVLMIIGAAVLIIGKDFRGNDKYFPSIIGAGMVITAIWMAWEDRKQDKACIDLTKINFAAVGITIVALAAYMALFRLIGYVLSTILLGISIILGLRYNNVKGAILWPTLMVLVVFVIFRILLKVPLPVLFL